jgi:hypothetical protein
LPGIENNNVTFFFLAIEANMIKSKRMLNMLCIEFLSSNNLFLQSITSFNGKRRIFFEDN